MVDVTTSRYLFNAGIKEASQIVENKTVKTLAHIKREFNPKLFGLTRHKKLVEAVGKLPESIVSEVGRDFVLNIPKDTAMNVMVSYNRPPMRCESSELHIHVRGSYDRSSGIARYALWIDWPLDIREIGRIPWCRNTFIANLAGLARALKLEAPNPFFNVIVHTKSIDVENLLARRATEEEWRKRDNRDYIREIKIKSNSFTSVSSSSYVCDSLVRYRGSYQTGGILLPILSA